MPYTRQRQWMPGLLALALTLVSSVALSVAQAPQRDATPDEFDDIDIVQKHDNQIPVDARFTDHNGNEVQIGRYFDGTRPVVLVPVYFGCPQLCGLTLNGLLDTLKMMEWELGTDFRVVTLSFDHTESWRLGKAKRDSYLRQYGRPLAREDGWVFLTGEEDQIRRVTDAIGFEFRWNSSREEYAHAAALVLVTPQGHVAEYMGGVLYDPVMLRRLLVSASEGKVGSILDQVFLFCFHFDSSKGVFTPQAMRIMQAGGGLTVLVLAIFLVPVWVRSLLRRRDAPVPAAAMSGTDGMASMTQDSTGPRVGSGAEAAQPSDDGRQHSSQA